MTSMNDTSSFFTNQQPAIVPRDGHGRYMLPGPDGIEKPHTRATTFAATVVAQFGLNIWKERQVVWGLSRRPDLLDMATTISGPEDKKALAEIVKEAHIAAGTQAKANRGTAIHRACQHAEQGAFDLVPTEFQPHVSSYFAALRRHGIQVLPEYIERTGVVLEYDVAGTFDNLVLCADGKYRILDKKTGRLEFSDAEFAIQFALYAHMRAARNFDSGRWEELPEIETDYAITAHIDPVTGHTEMHRVDIRLGWLWCRTAAEVRDIRTTKHVITPLVTMEIPYTADLPSVANVAALPVGPSYPQYVAAENAAFVAAQQPNGHAAFSGPPAAHTLPVNTTAFTQNTTSPANIDSLRTPPVAPFWLDDEHDVSDDEPMEPVAEWQILSADVTRADELPHTAQSPIEITEQTGTVVEDLGGLTDDPADAVRSDAVDRARQRVDRWAEDNAPDATPPADTTATGDEIVAQLLKLKDKASLQAVARRLMARLGIAEGAPDALVLNKYKATLANNIVTLAHNRGVAVPGLTDGAPDLGTPSTPGNATASGSAPAKPKPPTVAEQKATRTADQAAHESVVRPAVASIRAAVSLDALQKLHDHYTQTKVGWSEEMQSAARTRGLELQTAAAETALTPAEMIAGATSQDTLQKAWNKATGGGVRRAAWTDELQQAANLKQIELAERAGVATGGNQ